MNDISERIQIQRNIIKSINSSGIFSERLLGLTGKAIERWANANEIKRDEKLLVNIFELSNKLFFLSNKSQEQITEEYANIQAEVNLMISGIEREVDRKILR